jgi:hypothetical protein
MNSNLKPSSVAPVVGVIDPDAASTGTYTTGWISMADFAALQAIVMAGTLGSSATLDAKIEQATDGSGTDSKDVTGKAITQLTQAGTDDSDKQAVIDVFHDDLDIDNDFTHVRLSVTLATAASDVGAVVLGHYAGFYPETDLASVAEIV